MAGPVGSINKENLYGYSNRRKRMGKFGKVVITTGILSFCFTPCFLIGHGGLGILPAGIVFFLILSGSLEMMYLGAALATVIPAFLFLSMLGYFYYGNNDLPVATKTDKKIYDPNKKYVLTFDYNECVNCPICNIKLKLDDAEIQAKQFQCTECESKIIFEQTLKGTQVSR